jgi:GNAT superfamily N-acetyltransferase
MEKISIEENGNSIFGYVVSVEEENWKNFLADKISTQEMIKLENAIAKSQVKEVAICKNLWVEKSQRRQGIGSDLFASFMDEAGADLFFLEADIWDSPKEAIINFYQNFYFDLLLDSESVMWYSNDDFLRQKLEESPSVTF